MTPRWGEELEDGELIRTAKAGGKNAPRAYEELVRRHQGWLVRLLTYILGGRSDGEDVAQEAFVRAYLKLDRCPDNVDFRAWMRVVGTRLAFNHRRDAKTRRRYHDKVERRSQVPASGQIEARDLLTECVAGLSYSYREVLILRYVEEMSIEEIAKTLDIGISAAKMRLSRARKEFWTVHGTLLEETDAPG